MVFLLIKVVGLDHRFSINDNKFCLFKKRYIFKFRKKHLKKNKYQD